jgi:hypothetical protein
MRMSAGFGASLAACLLLGLSGCTKVWRSEAMEGRVVDEGSGAPIADAVVLVNWQLKGMEGYPQGQLAIFERVTDAEGRFQIPAWGPKLQSIATTVSASDPTVRVFRNGYDPLVVRRDGNLRDNSHVKFLRLRRFEGTAADYAASMSTFWNPLTVNLGGVRCDWRAAPRLFQALVQVRGEFDAAGIPSDLPLAQNWCTGDAHRPPI